MTDDLDYFLLEIVSDTPRQLSDFSIDDIGLAFNLRVPHFHRQELIHALYDLFERGDLDAKLKPRSRRARPRPIHLTADLMEAGLVGALPIVVGLTAQGGRRWAALQGIDWQCWDHDRWWALRIGAITAASRAFAESLLAVELQSGAARPPVEWRKVKPWRPAYWHEEPVGYEVRFRLGPETSTQGNRVLPTRPLLAPRRARSAPPVTRPFATLTDRQVQSRIQRSDDLVAMEAVIELGRRPGQTQNLLRLIRWGAARRFGAVRALGDARVREAVPALLGLALGQHDVAAVEALARIGHRSALGPLLTLFRWLDRPGCSFAHAVGIAIVAFGEPGVQAIEQMMPFSLRHCERGIRALSHSPLPRAVAAVRRQLPQSEWLVIPALAGMGDDARRQLYDLALQESTTSRERKRMARSLAESPGAFANEARQLLEA